MHNPFPLQIVGILIRYIQDSPYNWIKTYFLWIDSDSGVPPGFPYGFMNPQSGVSITYTFLYYIIFIILPIYISFPTLWLNKNPITEI